MKKEKIKNNKGFVLLFAIVLSSIILAITMGVLNISLKEINFSTSAKETNDAFFAADTGAECALYNDRTDLNKFPSIGPADPITCAGQSITPVFSSGLYKFIIPDLGSAGKGCAIVTINKSVTPIKVISKGYNIGDSSCAFTGSSRVERQLELSY